MQEAETKIRSDEENLIEFDFDGGLTREDAGRVVDAACDIQDYGYLLNNGNGKFDSSLGIILHSGRVFDLLSNILMGEFVGACNTAKCPHPGYHAPLCAGDEFRRCPHYVAPEKKPSEKEGYRMGVTLRMAGWSWF